jgi:hypothetical protein
MAKVSRGKTLTYDEALAKLKALKKDHERFEKGQRVALYQRLQQVTAIALLVEADNDNKARFRKEMREKDVLRAALDFIFAPKSVAEKKEASKRTQALRYLIEHLEVAVEDVATAIQKHGGIEKLAGLAAKHRQDEDDRDQDDDENGEDQDEPEEADETRKPDSKFGKLISVGLSPKLTEKLNKFADKTRIKIIGYVRMPPDEQPTIEVKKIIEAMTNKKRGKSKAKPRDKKSDDDAGDWEE